MCWLLKSDRPLKKSAKSCKPVPDCCNMDDIRAKIENKDYHGLISTCEALEFEVLIARIVACVPAFV
jgi:hypothetical protein